MATGTLGTSARQYHTSQIHYIRKDISFSNGNGAVITLGVIPANSVVIRGGVVVSTAFNAGTANTLIIGTSADDDGFATALALGTIGVIVADEMATTNDAYVTADTTFTCTLTVSGTAATAGVGHVWIEYLPLI